MNAFWNGQSELEFWSLVELYLDEDYRRHHLFDGECSSRESVSALLANRYEVAGRLLVRLILDGEVVLQRIDTKRIVLEPITRIDQIVIDNTFELIETWICDFGGRLLANLDEEQRFDNEQEW